MITFQLYRCGCFRSNLLFLPVKMFFCSNYTENVTVKFYCVCYVPVQIRILPRQWYTGCTISIGNPPTHTTTCHTSLATNTNGAHKSVRYILKFFFIFCWPRISTTRQTVTHQTMLYQMVYWYRLNPLMLSTCCSKHVEVYK